MTRRQPEISHTNRAAEENSAHDNRANVLRATLWEQVRRRLSGGARGLKIRVCHDSTTVVLDGVVGSFYAKQVLYQLCRRCTPGFRVIDSTVVGTLPTQQG